MIAIELVVYILILIAVVMIAGEVLNSQTRKRVSRLEKIVERIGLVQTNRIIEKVEEGGGK